MGSLRLPRIAGLLYLVVVVAGLVVLKVVPDQIIVAGDAAATANNLRASETLFRVATLVDEMLWGLWLFPLGALQLRSGFVPRVVGVLAIVAGAGYVLDFAISLVVPDAANSLSSVASLAQAGELATVVWLLATRGDTTRAAAHKVVAVAG